MIVERTRIEGDNERQCRKIERIIHKPLIKKADRVNEDTDAGDYQSDQQISIPYAFYHTGASAC
jgi:ribulose bisphosphate carboxylase small subunit